MALTRINNNSLSNVTAAGLPEGSVIQVVEALKTDRYTESVTARLYSSDVTGLSVTITPTSSTSKLLIIASVSASNSQSAYRWAFGIFRDGSLSSLAGDAVGSQTSTTIGRIGQPTDTAALETRGFTGAVDAGSTGATTFSIRLLNVEGTTGNMYVNRSSAGTDANYITNAASSLVVMEIAGA